MCPLLSEVSAVCPAATDADPEETKQTDGLTETPGIRFQTFSASQKMVRIFCLIVELKLKLLHVQGSRDLVVRESDS